MPATEQALNSITLAVRVPVLSAKMYLTNARSSCKVMLIGCASFIDSSSYIDTSSAMKGVYISFTNSRETTKLIGMRVLSNIKYSP